MTTSDNAISSQSRAGPGSLVFVYNKAVQHMSSDRWLVIITNRASQLKHLFPIVFSLAQRQRTSLVHSYALLIETRSLNWKLEWIKMYKLV